MPYLTPDDPPDGTACFRVTIPGGSEYETIFKGALIELCAPLNFEEFGSQTAEETASAFAATIYPSLALMPCSAGAIDMDYGEFLYSLPTGTPGPILPAGETLVPFNGWYGSPFASLDSGYTVVAPGIYLSSVTLSLSYVDTVNRITIRNGTASTLAQSIAYRSFAANALTMVTLIALGEYTEPGVPDNNRQCNIYSSASAYWGPAVNQGTYPEIFARWTLLRLGDA